MKQKQFIYTMAGLLDNYYYLKKVICLFQKQLYTKKLSKMMNMTILSYK